MEITIKLDGRYLKVLIPAIISFIMIGLISEYYNTTIFKELMGLFSFCITIIMLITLIIVAIWKYLDLIDIESYNWWA